MQNFSYKVEEDYLIVRTGEEVSYTYIGELEKVSYARINTKDPDGVTLELSLPTKKEYTIFMNIPFTSPEDKILARCTLETLVRDLIENCQKKSY